MRLVPLHILVWLMLGAALATTGRAQEIREPVFAGALDATDEDADRKRLSTFAGFVESNAGKDVRLAIQVSAPFDRPRTVFSSWARLTWRDHLNNRREGALKPGASMVEIYQLTLAFCRCSGNIEAPYLIEIVVADWKGADRPDVTWVDGRLLIRGRFRVSEPKRSRVGHRFLLVPAPKSGGSR